MVRSLEMQGRKSPKIMLEQKIDYNNGMADTDG